MLIHDKSSLCFLGLTDLSIHKPLKPQASRVSAIDIYGEKSLPALQLRFTGHQNHVFATNIPQRLKTAFVLQGHNCFVTLISLPLTLLHCAVTSAETTDPVCPCTSGWCFDVSQPPCTVCTHHLSLFECLV